MLKNIVFKNHKSVIFKVRSFAVPTQKSRMLKHTIYASKNTGFIARPESIILGYGTERLKVTVEAGLNNLYEVILRQIDTTLIKKIFCFSTHQGGGIVNCIIAVTQLGVYYVPLFGNLTPSLIPNAQLKNFDCFAYSYSRDRDYIFASNTSGIYVADHSLVFEPLSTSIRGAKQMIVFDKRLFVLDADGETVYFTEVLDLLQFEGSIRVDSSFGKVLSLEVYENKLLIVCTNGFKILEASFDPSKFRISALCRSYEKIVDGSVKVLGDTIFFLTDGGMCKAVHGKISLLDVEFKPDGEICSTVYDNKYFLSNGSKMAVIEKFIDSITLYEGLDVRAFERVFNEFSDSLAILTSESGYVFQIKKGIGTQVCIWESEDFALTYAAGNQYIRQVLIKTTADIDLFVIGDRAQQRIRVAGSPDLQRINLNLKGDVFRIKIIAERSYGNADVMVSSLSVVVGFN